MPIDKIHTKIACIGCGAIFDITKEEAVNELNNHKCGKVLQIGYFSGQKSD